MESNLFSSAVEYHFITIDSDKSGKKPRGQDGAFPIAWIEYPETVSQVSGNSTFTQVDYPAFSIFSPDDTSTISDPELAKALVAVLRKISDPVAPTKITLTTLRELDK